MKRVFPQNNNPFLISHWCSESPFCLTDFDSDLEQSLKYLSHEYAVFKKLKSFSFLKITELL